MGFVVGITVHGLASIGLMRTISLPFSVYYTVIGREREDDIYIYIDRVIEKTIEEERNDPSWIVIVQKKGFRGSGFCATGGTIVLVYTRSTKDNVVLILQIIVVHARIPYSHITHTSQRRVRDTSWKKITTRQWVFETGPTIKVSVTL